MNIDTISKKEALQLGIVDNKGLGFVKPQTAFKNITEQLLAELKKGNLVWRKAWRSGVVVKGKTYGPQNYETQRPYTGGNSFFIHLQNMMNGTNYKFFLTPKQIAARGGKLKKGAKPFPVSVFIKNITEKTVTRDGEKQTVEYEEKGVIWYHVYPIDLVDNLTPIVRKQLKPDTFNEVIVADAEQIITGMPVAPAIKFGGDQAYYNPAGDYVQMPLKKAFKVQQNYYSVLFHELTHSTGHKKRLNRDLSGRFGSKNYAFEELIAEISAAFLCGVCEIEYHTINNSAAYLKSWSKTVAKEISEDPNFLKRAVFKAVRAANFIIGKTLEKHGKVISEKGEATDTAIIEPHYPGKEITPNKSVKASVSEAIKNLLTLPDYKGLSPMFLGMFYSDFKENDTIENVNGALKAKMYEKFAGKYLDVLDFDDFRKPTGIEYAQLNDNGQELINKIKARMQTLKAKKSGTDLFPELNGVTDAVLIFINAFLATHNKTVSKEDLLYILTNFQDAIKNGLVKAKHPLSAIANSTSDRLVKVINTLKPKQKIKLEISDKEEIENKILGLHGLGFWNVIASAVIGKAAEHLTHKHLTRNDKPEPVLSGLDGFVRADKSASVATANTYRLNGELGKLLLDIQPYKYSIVLTGDPHAGKTEFVMQLANGFADIGKTVGAFMLEQGGLESKDTKAAIDRNIKDKNKQNVFITGEAAKGIDTVKECASKFNVIIVDSWQKLGIPSTRFDDLRHEFPDTIFIVIFQQNGKGDTRGGVAADFDTPVHLKVHKVDSTFENNFVEVKKNRGNSKSLGLKYMVKAKKTLPMEE